MSDLIEPSASSGAAGEGDDRRLGRLERAAGVYVLRQHRLPGDPFTRAQRLAALVARFDLQRLAGRRAAVPVIDVGYFVGPEGRACLWSVTPLLPARSLAELLADNEATAPGRPRALAVRALEDGSAALVALEQRGIAHNDVRPEHLLFDGQRFVLSGFGEARAVAAAERSQHFRGEGRRPSWLPLRSPHEPNHRGRFVAPELFAAWTDVTAVPFAFDVFCLAATALEASHFRADFPYRALRWLPGTRADCPLDLFGRVVHSLWIERRLREQTPKDTYARPEAIAMIAPLPVHALAAPPSAPPREALAWRQRRRAEGRRQVEEQRAFWREAGSREDGWFAWHLFDGVLAAAPAARQTAVELHAFAQAAWSGVDPCERTAMSEGLVARHQCSAAAANAPAHGPWPRGRALSPLAPP